MEFFTKNELLKFSEYADKSYKKDEIESQKNRDIYILPTWDKTEYWSKEVARFFSNIIVVYGKRWIKPSKNTIFKPYTWSKIFTETNVDKEVYFTLGVDSEGNLLMKIDYQFESSKMSQPMKDLAHSLTRCEGSEEWKYCKIIGLNDISNYDWEKLIFESVEFIEGRMEIYEDIVSKLYNSNGKSQELFQFHYGNHDLGGIEKVEYSRVEKVIFFQRKHNEISLKIYEFLKEKYGHENISREQKTNSQNKIDIVRKIDDGFIIYEIKPYYNAKRSIREALGQILEYAHFKNDEKIYQLIIISLVPLEIDEKQYLEKLRLFYNIPIKYHWYDERKNELMEE